MKVSEIWVYPIKGLGGQKVDLAFATESGFRNDRRFMLVDKNNKFISQRSHSKMARLEVRLQDDEVFVVDKHDSSVAINFKTSELNRGGGLTSKVWKSNVDSVPFADSVNEWFSDFLGEDVSLVVQREFGNRKRSLPFKEEKIGMSFADGYPYLVLSKASVEDLSARINSSVDYRQFRANIILEDCEPYQEDELKSFSFTKSSFRMVKPCKRCPVININQDSGETTTNLTKELVKYRRSLNSVIFGMNAANTIEGIVNVNDTLNLS